VSIGPPPVGVAELQAALRAARAGQVRAGGERAPTPIGAPPTLSGRALPGRIVMVVGCHGGAGASTVALALAEAAGNSGGSVRLLDCASAQRSGLPAAVNAELGVDPRGWRRGRRGQLPVDRVAGVLSCAGEVPVPIDELGSRVEVAVVDCGWDAGSVMSGDSWLAQAAASAAIVLVARASIPGLRQLEQVLATCRPDPVVAVLGPPRWDRSVRAASGPGLLSAKAAGRVVHVPLDRHLVACGITCLPLPKAVAEAGRQIFARVLGANPQPSPGQDGLGPPHQPFTKWNPGHDHCTD
jgi:hypothetical protein